MSMMEWLMELELSGIFMQSHLCPFRHRCFQVYQSGERLCTRPWIVPQS